MCYRQPGKLQKFVADFHSGKLHREFHHGPDPEEQNKNKIVEALFAASQREL